MFKINEILSIVLLDISAIVLIAMRQYLVGWIILGIGFIILLSCHKQFKKDISLIYISMVILGITPITTDLSDTHFLVMSILLILAIAIPYTVSRYIYKDYLVKFKFHHGRNWYKTEILYIFLTAVVAYFLVPFFLQDTGSYLNWIVETDKESLTRLFIGTNGLGIWDELFFISTVLGILRRYMPFQTANLAQSVMFTSFLYELGFRGWGYVMIFCFALIQGYVFKKTESLLYVITIHLTLDFILYLALINAHHPDILKIFIT